jgi:Family of unknown function (DUF6941)
MTKVKLLAFLICDHVTRDSDGKVTIHDIFDRIVLPRIPVPYQRDRNFSVYYKVEALKPCVVSLCVRGPQRNAIPHGSWAHPIQQAGLMQSYWSLAHSLFGAPGTYMLQFSQRDDISPWDDALPGPLQSPSSVAPGSLDAAARILATAPLILEQREM